MKTRKSNNQALPRAWGNFLNQTSWTHFVTLTTYFKLTRNGARIKVESFIQRLRISPLENLLCFWIAEPSTSKEGYHIHTLLKIDNPEIPPKTLITGAWHKEAKPAGYGKHNLVHICDYNPDKGASYYVAKYLNRNDVDFDIEFSGPSSI